MYVVDTGPVLKFFATNNERWLFAALGHNAVHAPDAVRREVFSVPRRKPQFERAPRVWSKVEGRFIQVLSDSPTSALEEASRSVLGQSLSMVQAVSADLGEKMALLHASMRATAGDDVVLLCDDQGAQRLVCSEARRLVRVGAPGSIAVADTVKLLTWAVDVGAVADRAALRRGYEHMAGLDESLPRDIKGTGLLKSPPWPA